MFLELIPGGGCYPIELVNLPWHVMNVLPQLWFKHNKVN